MPKELIWPSVVDEALVERMIPALQRTIVDQVRWHPGITAGDVALAGPDVSNALLMVPATLLEPMPGCATSASIRRMAETAVHELSLFIRDTRLKTADMQEGGSTH